MLPELVLREEEERNHLLIVLLGLFSGLAGFGAAKIFFPGQTSVLSVVFASIPLVYPLTSVFLEDEKNGRRPHEEEVEFYGALFLGEFLAFLGLALVSTESFYMQASVFSDQAASLGLTGNAVSPDTLYMVLSNNLLLFFSILAVSAVIGSAGAFILTWNASVLGVFIAKLLSELGTIYHILTGSGQTPSPIAYVPHATLEMSGFIVAGITGSLVSAAVYREHFNKDTWKDLAKMVITGVLLIVLGALLESL